MSLLLVIVCLLVVSFISPHVKNSLKLGVGHLLLHTRIGSRMIVSRLDHNEAARGRNIFHKPSVTFEQNTFEN